VPGLNLSLPSEARWEYACRAGTKDATYVGPIKIGRDGTAPVLDAIAWYDGNSGESSTPDEAQAAGGRRSGRGERPERGTHPVGQKAPNAWGLYDMLGNVWERCADEWHDSHDGVPSDGSPRTGRGAAHRVIRSGSWDVVARFVRAAYRDGFVPADRFDDLGFRCARVQGSVRQQRRAGRSKPSERSETAATTSPKRRR
jgi:formylglycine-generating enzyme required for sulfatase activity